MKAVKITKNRCIEFSDFEEPYSSDNSWTKIKVRSAGLCGSDIQKLSKEELLHYSGTEILGHEISGDIVDQDKINFSSGTRVMVMPLIPCYECEECSSQNQNLCHNLKSIGKDIPGGFAEYAIVPTKNLRKLSDSVDYDTGACADMLAVSIHCFNISDKPSDNKILIIGDGPLGLSCTQLYALNNSVTVLGKHDINLDVARSYGAETINHIDNRDVDYYDIVVEAVGRKQSSSILDAIRSVKAGGKIVSVGVFGKNYKMKFPLRDVFFKEASIKGVNSYLENEFDIAVDMINSGKVDYSRINTHIIPLEEFKHGLDLVANRSQSEAIKIIYRP